jgi:hypothetical protein
MYARRIAVNLSTVWPCDDGSSRICSRNPHAPSGALSAGRPHWDWVFGFEIEMTGQRRFT